MADILNIKTIHINEAGTGWKLIMQSGVGVPAVVGLTLADFMEKELGLIETEQNLIEALVLDGMPVDDPQTAIVPDGSRLAFAAGLPGITGLAMKKNSAVKALRNTITHKQNQMIEPHKGRITLALYSLVLPRLAGHFLKRGIIITPAQFQRYARFSPEDICCFEGGKIAAGELAMELSSGQSYNELLLTAIINNDPDAGANG